MTLPQQDMGANRSEQRKGGIMHIERTEHQVHYYICGVKVFSRRRKSAKAQLSRLIDDLISLRRDLRVELSRTRAELDKLRIDVRQNQGAITSLQNADSQRYSQLAQQLNKVRDACLTNPDLFHALEQIQDESKRAESACDEKLQKLQVKADQSFGRISDVWKDHYASNVVAAQNHKTFAAYKNKHLGETVVILGAAPTLSHFDPLPHATYIGMNTAFDYEKVQLDYFFCIDNIRIPALKDIQKFKNSTCPKFFGQHSDFTAIPIDRLEKWHIPTSFIEECNNAHLFYFAQYGKYPTRDISALPLNCFNASGVFTMLEFALWCGFKKIYVVGCDCTLGGHFNDEKGNPKLHQHLIRAWHLFADYTKIFHPSVKIISVNPIGLKGLYDDVYTPSYLGQNPDIDRSGITLLDSASS